MVHAWVLKFCPVRGVSKESDKFAEFVCSDAMAEAILSDQTLLPAVSKPTAGSVFVVQECLDGLHMVGWLSDDRLT